MSQVKPGPAPEGAYDIIAYVNAYRVSQLYGGPEEGGWHYPSGEPIAAVPIRAKVLQKHETEDESDEPCAGCRDEDGEFTGFCRFAELYPNEEDEKRARDYLGQIFGDVEDKRSSVRLSIRVEEVLAYPWPARKPHYE